MYNKKAGIGNKRVLEHKLVSLRREIHQYPELGNEEVQTSALISRFLETHGVKVLKLNPTGLIGTVKGKGKPGKKVRTVVLRADIDALPIQEHTSHGFVSKIQGKMHACGHDANTAIVAGAAVLLSEQSEKFGGTARFVFQPNEEGSTGARNVVSSGQLDNPKTDVIMGVHVSPSLPVGTIGVKYGAMFAAVDKLEIMITGEGGHAAYPHKGQDLVVAAAEIVQELQTIVSRKMDPTDSVVVTIGTINGGTRWNVLASEVKMTGTIRCFSDDVLNKVRAELRGIVTRVCSKWHAKFVIKNNKSSSPLINNEKVAAFIVDSLENSGIVDVRVIDKPSMGGEDFSVYLNHYPGCFVYAGTGNNAKPATLHQWHHSRFDIDEKGIRPAAEALAYVVRQMLVKGGSFV
ncbi:MAG: M20 family metallopeptidase [Elusimicrobiota bacterium]